MKQLPHVLANRTATMIRTLILTDDLLSSITNNDELVIYLRNALNLKCEDISDSELMAIIEQIKKKQVYVKLGWPATEQWEAFEHVHDQIVHTQDDPLFGTRIYQGNLLITSASWVVWFGELIEVRDTSVGPVGLFRLDTTDIAEAFTKAGINYHVSNLWAQPIKDAFSLSNWNPLPVKDQSVKWWEGWTN
jgi:hypothetical protein